MACPDRRRRRRSALAWLAPFALIGAWLPVAAWAARPAPLPGPAGPMWLGPAPPGRGDGVVVVLEPDSGRLYLELRDALGRPWEYHEGHGWTPPAAVTAPPAPLPLERSVESLGVDVADPGRPLGGADWDGASLHAIDGAAGWRVRVLYDDQQRPAGLLLPGGERIAWQWGPSGVTRFDGRRSVQGRVGRENGLQYVNAAGGVAAVRWGEPVLPSAAGPEAPSAAAFGAANAGGKDDQKEQDRGAGADAAEGAPKDATDREDADPADPADPAEAIDLAQPLDTLPIVDLDLSGAAPAAPADAEADEAPAGPRAGWVEISDGEGRQVSARRDEAGRWVELGDPRGTRTQLVYAPGRLDVITAGGERWALKLDDEGRPLEALSPGGRRWAYERDAAGRLLAAIDPAGGATRWRRDDEGRVVEVLWSGESTRLERDAAGRLVGLTVPGGGKSRLIRGEGGRVEAVIDPSGAKVGLIWDGDGGLIGLTAADGGEWGFGRDSAGRLDAFLWPSGASLRFDRNGEGLVDLVDRDGWGSLRVRRGGDGAPTALEDSFGRKTGLIRDSLGRVRQIRRSDGTVLVLERDPLGELVAVVGETGVVRIPRDIAGRPLAAGPTRWAWDSDGGLSAMRVGNVDLRFSRDAAGRLRGVQSGAWASEVQRDPRGLPTRWRSPEGELRVRRDARGLPIAEEGPLGEVSLVRDARGFITRVRSPEGEWAWSRDAQGRPLRLQSQGLSVGFDWDLDGHLALERLPGGVIHTHAWDQNVVQDVVLGPSGQPIAQRSAALSLDGRVRWLQDGDGPRQTWRYDPLGALVAVEQGDVALWSFSATGAVGPQGFMLVNDRLGRPAESRPGSTLPLFGVGQNAAVLERDAAGRVVAARGDLGELTLSWGGAGWLTGATGATGDWELRRDPRGWPIELSSPSGIETLRFFPLGEGPGSGDLLLSGAQVQRRWAAGPGGPVAWADEQGEGSAVRLVGGGGLALSGAGAPLRVESGPLGGPDAPALGPAVASAAVRLFPGGPIVGVDGAWDPLSGARLDGLRPPPWATPAHPGLAAWSADPAGWAPVGPWASPLRLLSALGVLQAEAAEGEWVAPLAPEPAFAFLPASADAGPWPLGPPPGAVPIDEHPVVVALLRAQLQGRAPLDVERALLALVAEEVGASAWTERWVPGLSVPGQDILAPRPVAPWPDRFAR